ncbi:MAG: hypothetical protein AB7F89_12380 [Pirellulaceae bacterium]
MRRREPRRDRLRPVLRGGVWLCVLGILCPAGDAWCQGPGAVGRVDPPAVDEEAVRAAGLRRLSGRHLILYTDLPASSEVDELPYVFDAAVPQWCEYFDIPAAGLANWVNIGALMQDKARFVRAGLLPDNLPPFPNGYQRGAQLWLYEQPSAYYRRHLLLHEGTHAIVHTALGGEGPPWYFEGVAELLATHEWRQGTLRLNYFPGDKREVEEWGRIKIVRDAALQSKTLTLPEIMNYGPQSHLRVEAYGWSWAAAAFFDGHPRYRGPFRKLPQEVRSRGRDFSSDFLARLPVDAGQLRREWELFTSRLDYGYDVAREAIQPKPVAALPSQGARVSVAADRGWQSTGWRLEAGVRYRIEASGRCVVAREPRDWWTEPTGVTLRYCDGRPLGMLLGALVDEQEETSSANGLLTPAGVGAGLDTTPRRGGTLYLRVNDYASELSDNQGEFAVRVTPLPDAP